MTDQYKRPDWRDLLKEVMEWHANPDSNEYNDCDKDLCMWCEWANAAIAAAPPEPDEVRRLEREIAENWAGMYINGAHECYYADGWLDIDRYCHKGVARDFMRKAARYLELRGLLEHHPTEPKLVRIRKEEGK